MSPTNKLKHVPLLRLLFVVARKELMDAFRDKRSIYSVVIGAMVGPIMIGFLLNRIADQQRGAQEIQVPVVGREHAPVLVNWLEQQPGVEITAGPKDAEAAVRDRKLDFVLVIPKEFPEKFRASRPAPVGRFWRTTWGLAKPCRA